MEIEFISFRTHLYDSAYKKKKRSKKMLIEEWLGTKSDSLYMYILPYGLKFENAIQES